MGRKFRAVLEHQGTDKQAWAIYEGDKFIATLGFDGTEEDARLLAGTSEHDDDEQRYFEFLAETIMPFGKHEGKGLGYIPLRYLDETVSVMPSQWIVRSAREFVNLCMKRMILGGVDLSGGVPSMSMREVLDSRRHLSR